MRGRPMTIGALLVASAALTGCVPQPVATPTPTPTYACTPEAGGAEYRCDERDYEAMKAKDALYAEAERVFRDVSNERIRLYRSGAMADDAALRLTTGTATQLLREGHAKRPQLMGGEIRFDWITRVPGLSREGSVVTLAGCWDAHTATASRDGVPTGSPGGVWQERAYFVPSADGLKITDFERKPVSECES